jgi:hypothetical protein
MNSSITPDAEVLDNPPTRVVRFGARRPRSMHRTTIAAPQALIEEALHLGQQVGLTSLNAVVQVALEEFAERRRREAFAAAMVEMSRDPDVVRESDQITELFQMTDGDGIG